MNQPVEAITACNNLGRRPLEYFNTISDDEFQI